MSSLRRRAIWVQRAMSTERSSIGGRASARTTAAASEGSASSRSQASTSRISARWKKAASPTSAMGHGALLERDGHRLALARDRRHHDDDRPRIDALTGDQALDIPGHRLGLRAIVGAAPELHLAARDASGTPIPRQPARGTQDTLRAALALAVELDHAPPGGLKAAHRAPIRRHGSAAAPAPGRPPPSDTGRERSRTRLAAARSSSWASSMSRCSNWRSPPGCSRARRSASRTTSPASRAPRLGQHPLVRPVDLGELPLDRPAAGGSDEPRGPGRVGLGADQLGLQPVDPAHKAAEQRVGAAAEVVVLERELVDPLDQHRQAVAGRRASTAGTRRRRRRAARRPARAAVSTNSCS